MAADATALCAPAWARGLTVSRSHQRQKTASVEVGPDLSISVRVPASWSDAQILGLIERRERWLLAQAGHFKRFDPRTPARSYVGGETHRHLGRQLMLRVIVGPCVNDEVEVRGRELVVQTRRTTTPARIAAMIDAWRRREARTVFGQRLDAHRSHYLFASHPSPRLQLRSMTGRWGSLSAGAVLTLNPALVQAPLACIDCVIQHELCHLLVREHSPQFFELMDRLNPRWRKQRAKLEAMLS
jgi:predicted metal-dependent hydrolase